MNFLTLGAKTLKKAQKAMREQESNILKANGLGMNIPMATPQEVFDSVIENEMRFMEQAMDIGLRYFEMAKTRLGSNKENVRHYMLSVRPPEGTNFVTFKRDTEEFINKWVEKWCWVEYAYEQKGESIETMGKGFHCHMVFATKTPNYYPTHILRDAKRQWTYVAANCIQCDTLNNVERARYYIRGDKNDEKEAAVMMDNIWRQSLNMENLVVRGQVQPLTT